MDIKAYLAKKKDLVDKALEKLVPPAKLFPTSVHEAMRYSLFAGGKRVRPILAIAAAEALGARTADLLPVAGALELIHTYSLIHDDLPAMDNDDFRRGRPTCHKVYGEAVAILAGDGLLNMAFEVLSDPRRLKAVPAKQARCDHQGNLHGLRRFRHGGRPGRGHGVRRQGSGFPHAGIHPYTQDRRAHPRLGPDRRALCKGGQAAVYRALPVTGRLVGLAFQIADDILDITGTQETIGKDVGSDIKKGKKTFPSFYGLEESRARAAEVADKAVQSLKEFDRKADPLRELAKYIVNRVN